MKYMYLGCAVIRRCDEESFIIRKGNAVYGPLVIRNRVYEVAILGIMYVHRIVFTGVDDVFIQWSPQRLCDLSAWSGRHNLTHWQWGLCTGKASKHENDTRPTATALRGAQHLVGVNLRLVGLSGSNL